MSAGSFLVSDQKSRVSHPRLRHVAQGEAPKPSYVLLHFPRAVLRRVDEGNPARSLRAETYRARYRFGVGVQRVAVFGVSKEGGADGPTAAGVPSAFFRSARCSRTRSIGAARCSSVRGRRRSWRLSRPSERSSSPLQRRRRRETTMGTTQNISTSLLTTSAG